MPFLSLSPSVPIKRRRTGSSPRQGKEKLYKEVVATYQEKKPKVYGLEVYEGQHLVQIKLNRAKITHVGASFRGFARLSVNLTFLATALSDDQGKEILAFCLPASQSEAYGRVIRRIAPEIEFRETPSVIIFSMNGPHFGDRYGIVSELLRVPGEPAGGSSRH